MLADRRSRLVTSALTARAASQGSVAARPCECRESAGREIDSQAAEELRAKKHSCSMVFRFMHSNDADCTGWKSVL